MAILASFLEEKLHLWINSIFKVAKNDSEIALSYQFPLLLML
jgi:hypothetical protein